MKEQKSYKLIFDIIPSRKHAEEVKIIKNDYSGGEIKFALISSFLILVFASVIAWQISPLLPIKTAKADEEMAVDPVVLILPELEDVEEMITVKDYSAFYNKSEIETPLPWFYSSKTNKKIEIDLERMILATYYYDQIQEYPVVAKGPPQHSTPTGSFNVLLKRPLHFSSKSHVWMPWSIQFHGDYFMHEIPYWPNGRRLTSQYSGGCVRLNIGDAKKVYDFVEVGMPVIVY